MRRIFALLLCVLMCFGLLACGNSDTQEVHVEDLVSTTETEVSAEMTEVLTQEAEDNAVPDETEPTLCLSVKELESLYQMVMNGQVAGEGVALIQRMDENMAKQMLDAMAYMFSPDTLIEQIESFDSKTMDMVLMEANYVYNSWLNEAASEDSSDEQLVNDEMGTTMVLYDEDLNRSLIIELDENHAFMEPDWAAMTDQPINYFLYMDDNYQLHTLQYGMMKTSTEDLIANFVAAGERENIQSTVSEVETFMLGGVQWEIFTRVYERTGTGINKETGLEESSTATYYNVTCFARPDSETALQISTSESVNPDIADYYLSVLFNSIKSITIR